MLFYRVLDSVHDKILEKLAENKKSMASKILEKLHVNKKDHNVETKRESAILLKGLMMLRLINHEVCKHSSFA